jgi:capsular polysaccharide biosynthesis protein
MVFPLALIPQEILSVSHFVIGSVLPAVVETLSLFGIESRVIVLRANEYIMADFVYVFPELKSRTFMVWLVRQRFREFAVRKWNLDRIVPTGIGVLNREKGRCRHIADLKEITHSWQREWSSYQWIYLDGFGSFRDAAEWFNQRKVVVAATGAGCLGAVFMKAKCWFVELQSVTCFGFFVDLAASVGLKYVVMSVPGMRHWIENHVVLGEERAMQLKRFIVEHYSD